MSSMPASATATRTPGHDAVIAVWLDARDDVATVLRAIEPGERVRVQCGGAQRDVAAREAIPLGHKVALREMDTGTRVRKYGEFIGRLTADVREGAWVHTHNLTTAARRTTAEELAWREQSAPAAVRVAPPGGTSALAAAVQGATRYVAHRGHGYVQARSGEIAPSTFADLGAFPGEPVATAVDADDHVWVALWDAGALLRYDPRGNLVRVVRLPVTRPTALAFSHESDELLVSTSGDGFSAARLASEPLAGQTLAIDVGVPGPRRHEAVS